MSLPYIWVESVTLEEKSFSQKKKKSLAVPHHERSTHMNMQGLHQLPVLSTNWII